MATSTVAGAKSEGTPAKPRPNRPPRPLIRLMRYVVPYGWPLLASVGLMAMVGLLDAGRVLLIRPIFDRVLNPGIAGKNDPVVQTAGQWSRSQSRANWCRRTFTIHGRLWPLRWWPHGAEGDLRLCWNLPRKLRGLA